jgi:hypothetical protein
MLYTSVNVEGEANMHLSAKEQPVITWLWMNLDSELIFGFTLVTNSVGK